MSLGMGGETAATPVAAFNAYINCWRFSKSLGRDVFAVMTKGPLNPGPKPSEIKSYARRVVVSSG